MFELLIMYRYLITKKKEKFISIINILAIIGISLGVATLIVVMSVMNGYKKELINRILGINGHINIEYIGDNNDDINNIDNIISNIKRIKHIKSISPIFVGQAMISVNDLVSGVLIRGMITSDIENKTLMYDSLINGNWKNYDSSENNIAIGNEMAKQLGLEIGDKIKLILPKFNNTIIGSIPRIKTFTISAIFDIGMYEYNSSILFMHLKIAKALFDKQNQIDNFEIIIDDLNNLEYVKNTLVKTLSYNWRIIDLQASNQSLVEALEIERNVMFFILSLIIIIAAFNIISSLMILVKDKQKSIAILRTIGASKASIVRIFIMCGFTIGFVGTIFGSALGIIFSLNIENIRKFLEKITNSTLFDPMIYFLTRLPVDISMIQIFIIIILSLSLSLIVTIYPALKIAKLSPADVLRYE